MIKSRVEVVLIPVGNLVKSIMLKSVKGGTKEEIRTGYGEYGEAEGNERLVYCFFAEKK